MPHPLSPNSTIGILGGGQLGRMLAQAGQQLGYKIHIFSDEAESPACQVTDLHTISKYSDKNALKKFAQACQIVTYEFENIPLESAEYIEGIKPVLPDSRALAVFQNRILEKTFLKENGVPCAPFAPVRSLGEFLEAIETIRAPSVLKTAGLGYDGKGQTKIRSDEDIIALKDRWQKNDYVLEAFVDLKMEFSVPAARGKNGEFKSWGPVENEHRNHILHISLAPARVEQKIAEQAMAISEKIAKAINYIGVFCVEFFLTKSGELLVNEIAPRVHNSGHLTIEASRCSQFEQHIRAISGMELGDPSINKPYAMLNLLGDVWNKGEPDWKSLEAKSGGRVHLYGKKDAKIGRKMGHLTFAAENQDQAYKKAEELYQGLTA